MASGTRALNILLASPPALRAAIARDVFGIRVTNLKSRATITTRDPPSPNTHNFYFRLSLSRGFHTKTRLLSSSTPIQSSPSVSTSSHSANKTETSGRLRRFLTTSSLVLVFFTFGFAMAATPVIEAANGLLNPPTDSETLDLFVPPTPTSAEINEYIISHPLSNKLRAQEGMVESRPHMKIPPAMRAHNLTAGTLLGEGMMEVPPLTFAEKEEALPTLVQIVYLGPALCGHPGIVHGGLLATLLDEGLARACFPALPNKVGVTATLKIDYRKPCPGSSYVVLKAETTKVEGRKAWVKGWIELLGDEDATGTVIVEAEALFIEPKHAKTMARAVSGT